MPQPHAIRLRVLLGSLASGVLLSHSTFADPQDVCLVSRPENEWIQCVDTLGCSSSADMTTCSGSLRLLTMHCDCGHPVLCCGASLTDYWETPCGFTCAGGASRARR
jgi:hypothetical protein